MAKNGKPKKSGKLDDVLYDPDLDFNLGDDEFTMPKDNRKPTTRVAQGALAGMKSTLVDPSFIRKVTKEALPKGYGDIMDLTDTATSTLKDLYNNAQQEMRPVYSQLQRTVDKALPLAKDYLPKGLAEKLQNFADKGKEQKAATREDPRTLSMMSSLNETFGESLKAQLTAQAQQDVKDKLNESIQFGRHKETFGQLERIGQGIDQLVQYQNKITYQYQRKSLELQHRQYFATIDLLESSRTYHKQAAASLGEIVKNTGLPDIVKTTPKESLMGIMRNQFWEGLAGGFLDKRREFLRNVGNRLTKAAGEKIKGFADDFKSGLSQAGDMAEDMRSNAEMLKSMGVDTKAFGQEQAGNLAGSLATDALGTKLGKMANKHLRRIPGVEKYGNKGQEFTANLPQHAKKFARSSTGDDLPWFLGDIVRFAKDQTLAALNPTTGMVLESSKDMMAPSAFTNQTRKTINDIIPGYLARIHQEIRKLRTGKDNIELMHFDFDKGSFADESDHVKNIKATFVDKDTKTWVKRDVNDLINMVDKEGTLSPEQRQALGQFMLKDNLNNNLGGKRLSSTLDGFRDVYTGDAAKHGKAYADLFKKYFADDKDSAKETEFAIRYGQLGRDVKDRRFDVQNMINLGQGDMLKQLGILSKDGKNMDMEKYYSMFLEDDEEGGSSSPLGGGGPGIPPVGPKRPRKPIKPRKPGGQFFGMGHGFNPHMSPPGYEAAGPNTTAPPQMQQMFQQQQAQHRPFTAPKETHHSLRDQILDIIDILLNMKQMMANGLPTIAMNLSPDKMKEFFNTNITKLRPDNVWNSLRSSSLGKGAASKWGMVQNKWQTKWGKELNTFWSKHGKGTWDKLHHSWSSGEMKENAKGLYKDLRSRSLKDWRQAGAEAVEKGTDFVKGKYQQVQDLYVGGELKPRIDKAKLAAGEYYDEASKKVIKSLEDIKGRVLDKDGKLILDFNDLKDSVIKGPNAKKALRRLRALGKLGQRKGSSAAGKIGGWLQGKRDDFTNWRASRKQGKGEPEPEHHSQEPAKDNRHWWEKTTLENIGALFGAGFSGAKAVGRFGGRVAGTAGTIAKTGAKASWWATKATTKFLSAKSEIEQDIYVEGEREPRLEAVKLKRHYYIDVNSRKVIHQFSDITGEVKDRMGNVVLSEDELAKAYVVENQSRRITKIGKFFLGAGKKALGVANALTLGGFGGVTALWRGAKTVANFLNKNLGACDVYVKGEDNGPSLMASLMRKGFYISSVTHKPIYSFKDIDGPVLDRNEETRLSYEQLQKGLVDVHGKPLRTNKFKVASLLLGGALKVGKLAKKAGDWLFGQVSASFGNLGGIFKHIFGEKGILFGATNGIKDRLDKIIKILEERMKAPPRKGSVEDQEAQREAREAKYKKSKEDEANINGGPDKATGGGGKGLLAGLASLLKGRKKGDGDEDEGGSGTSLSDVKAGAEMGGSVLKKGWGLAKGAGKGLLKYGKKLIPFGSKAALGAMATEGALAATGATAATAATTTAATAATAATGGGLLAGLGSAAMSGLGVLGSGLVAGAGLLGSAAAGLAGVIASPVVLTGLAIGAAGYGLYKGYKYFTRDNMTPLMKLRYAQYGFQPSDTQYAHFVFGLEDSLVDAVTFAGGQAQIDAKKLKDPKKLVEAFGVDTTNKQQLGAWLSWFNGRFKPVFLTTMSALNQVKAGMSLGDIEKLNPEEKKKFFDAAKFPSGPYDNMTSPIPDLQALTATKQVVQTVTSQISDDIDSQTKNGKSTGNKTALDNVLGLAGKAGAGLGKAVLAGTPLPLALKGAQALGYLKDPATKMNSQDFSKISDSGLANDRGMLYVAPDGSAMNQAFNGQVDGLSAIRYKAYGLTAMEADKIRALDTLEKHINTKLSFDSSKKAIWKGDATEVLNKVGGQFGIDGPRGSRADNWLKWFNYRFMPLYLNYVTALYASTNKTDPALAFKSLRPGQVLDVAMAVLGTSSKTALGVTSFWTLASSPWDGYELNSKVATTEPNLQGLKDAAKNSTLQEQKGLGTSQTPGQEDQKKAATDGKATGSNSQQDTSLWGKVTGAVSSVGQSLSNAASSIAAGAKSAIGTAASYAGIDLGADYQPGHGTGGDINSLPMPQGDGSYTIMKPLLDAVAKMTGVDPALLAMMCAQESGFHAKAKPGTSHASGLFQFIPDTWKTMMKKYASKYGINPNTSPEDPRANALMGAEYVKENAQGLSSVKKNLTDTDLYLAHFLGLGGARTFLKGSPDAIGAQVLPKAAAANASIFYEGGNKQQPRTVSQIYQFLNHLLQTKAKQFGIAGAVKNGSEAIVAKGTVPATQSTTTASSSAGSSTSAAGATAATKATAATGTASKTDSNIVPTQKAQAAKANAGTSSTTTGPSIPTGSPLDTGTTSTAKRGGAVMAPAASATPEYASSSTPSGISSSAVSSIQDGINASNIKKNQPTKASTELIDINNKQLEQSVKQTEILGRIYNLLNKQGGTNTTTTDQATTTGPQSSATATPSASQAGQTSSGAKPVSKMLTGPISFAKGEW